jgi:hypothetical protein
MYTKVSKTMLLNPYLLFYSLRNYWTQLNRLPQLN